MQEIDHKLYSDVVVVKCEAYSQKTIQLINVSITNQLRSEIEPEKNLVKEMKIRSLKRNEKWCP